MVALGLCFAACAATGDSISARVVLQIIVFLRLVSGTVIPVVVAFAVVMIIMTPVVIVAVVSA